MEEREEIARALRATAAEIGWTVTTVAATANRTEGAARAWWDASASIGGPELLILMRAMPGLKERLLPSNPPAVAAA